LIAPTAVVRSLRKVDGASQLCFVDKIEAVHLERCGEFSGIRRGTVDLDDRETKRGANVSP
jgi:hypothetical protein